MTMHISSWKKKQLEELTALSNEYPVIAIANLSTFPAALFQQLRKKLCDKAQIRVSKTRVIRKAFEQSDIDSEKLNSYVNESVGIIFTTLNPFELYSFIKKNKGNVSAKVGDIAPEDIVVPAGDTGIPPGPALSDLKGAGLKVMVQGATIFISEDTVVTKKGEAVTGPVAGTLSKLDIKPMKVGLNIVACYENKEIFEASVLNIDIDEVRQKFISAYTGAFNLAFNAGYFIKETIPLLIQKAFRDAKAVALEGKVLTPETIETFIGRAAKGAAAIKAKVPESAPAEKAKEEVPAAETPAEKKAEEAPTAEEAPAEAPAEEKVEEKPAEEAPAEEAKEAEEKPAKAEEKKE